MGRVLFLSHGRLVVYITIDHYTEYEVTLVGQKYCLLTSYRDG